MNDLKTLYIYKDHKIKNINIIKMKQLKLPPIIFKGCGMFSI